MGETLPGHSSFSVMHFFFSPAPSLPLVSQVVFCPLIFLFILEVCHLSHDSLKDKQVQLMNGWMFDLFTCSLVLFVPAALFLVL